MKNETTYNGWTNYETWRINLEFFDNNIVYDYCTQYFDQCGDMPTVYDVQCYLIEHINFIVENEYEKSFLIPIAEIVFGRVNYREIAETQLNDIIESEKIKEILQTEES